MLRGYGGDRPVSLDRRPWRRDGGRWKRGGLGWPGHWGGSNPRLEQGSAMCADLPRSTASPSAGRADDGGHVRADHVRGASAVRLGETVVSAR